MACRTTASPRRILVGMRLALMDEPLRRVLGLAAAVGATEISLSQLRAGAAALKPPVDIPVLFDALDRALRLHLLEERGDGYTFRHPVVRSVLYHCLPRHRRDELRTPPALAVPVAEFTSIDCLPGLLLPAQPQRLSCILRRLLEEHYGTCWKSAGMYAIRLGQGKQRKYLPGVFTETYSLLFPGACGRPASARHQHKE